MQSLLVTVFLISAVILLVRSIRWLAIAQQKEYRWDRLWLFVQSSEGKKEFWRVLNWYDFTRSGLKRPRITARIVVTTLVVFGLLLLLVKVLQAPLNNFFESQLLALLTTALIIYVCIPLLVGFIAILPGFAVYWYSEWLLEKAAQKLKVQQPLVIGITGSFGKTATKMLLAHVLSTKQPVFMPPKSHNTVISVAKSILSSYHDQKIAIIEYAAYKKGEIARLARKIHPEIAIVTGLTDQHIGLFGSIENIIAAKRELLNALDVNGKIYSANPSADRIVIASPDKNKNISFVHRATSITGKLLEDGVLQVSLGSHTVKTKLVGLQYLDTVKTVVHVAQDLGISEKIIAESLADFNPPAGFTRLTLHSSGARILDDGGTSNPVGFKAALDLATQITAERKILVTSGIVDLGDASELIHTTLAQSARSVADEVWYVGSAGIEQFEEKFGQQLFSDRTQIIEKLANLEKDELLIVEGRMPSWLLEKLK